MAERFAAKHGVPRAAFLERIGPRMTRLERLRLQGAGARHEAGVVRDRADLAALPPTRLASYALSLSLDERAARRAEPTGAFRTAARRVAGARAGTWGKVTAVLDDSHSTYGSGQKRRRPLAVALACHHLLEALAAPGAYTPLWLSGRTAASRSPTSTRCTTRTASTCAASTRPSRRRASAPPTTSRPWSSSPASLPALVELARFAEGRAGLGELRG
ncbi:MULTISPECIES: hypothetical protein [Actinomadura]|uniref:Transposase n=1 Tax=Actinomadura yumaensis TaxID=111807 RepID=A0ABW2CYM9_9ACTN|nr:hypothetical protein [Actinomadura sp. J1-007]